MKTIIVFLIWITVALSQPMTSLIDSSVSPPTSKILMDSAEVWGQPNYYKFDQYTWVKTYEYSDSMTVTLTWTDDISTEVDSIVVMHRPPLLPESYYYLLSIGEKELAEGMLGGFLIYWYVVDTVQGGADGSDWRVYK